MKQPIFVTFLIVAAAIVIDALLGVIKAAKDDCDSFDFRKLPKFLANGVLPYVGGLGILALAAEFVGDVFIGLFYPAAAAVTAKYVAEIKDKLIAIFGVQLTNDGGVDN
jgi:hypothetical protein